jgi:hypothetical protein
VVNSGFEIPHARTIESKALFVSVDCRHVFLGRCGGENSDSYCICDSHILVQSTVI